MTGRGPEGPDRWAVWLITRVLPPAARDSVIGDLHERYGARVARDGRMSARRWYWRQTAAFVLRIPVERTRLALKAGLPSGRSGSGRGERGPDLDTQRAIGWLERTPTGLSGSRSVEDLRRDLAFGLRAARRAPMFTLLAVVTLALGVGANTAVFGVLKSVLLDPLPYGDGDRLVRIEGRSTDGTAGSSALSAGAVLDYSVRQRTFESMASFYPTTWEVIYRPGDGPRVLLGGGFESGFLETLGVQPVIGRAIASTETPQAGSYAVMLSYDVWRAEFAADPGVIGRPIRVDADTWEIVGVLPPGFTGPMGSADIWFAVDVSTSLSDPVRSRRSEWLGLVARLKPGVTATDARRDLSAIAADLAREYPASDAGRSVAVVSLRDSMAGDTRMPLLVLMASAILVLIIACANLAGSLLSRTITRRGELAVRVALGAGQGRLVKQLLTESIMLAVAGSLLGLLLAGSGLAVVSKLDVPGLPAYADLSLDGGAILLAAVLALCAGAAIGSVPAWTARRSSPQKTLRDSGWGAMEGLRSSRLRGILLSGQLALGLSLLVGAGLLARSLVAMTNEPLGFDPDGVLTVSVKGPVPERDAVRKQFFVALEERARSLPGVVAAANTSALPGPAMSRTELAIRGTPRPAGGPRPTVPYVTVSDDWFTTMRIPLLRGRGFGSEDGENTPPVIVISEAMARAWWPAGNAIGARVRLGSDSVAPWAEVVGIVGNVRTDPARTSPEPMAYGTSRQAPMRESRVYVLRTEGDPRVLAGPFRAELMRLDPSVPMNHVRTLNAILDGNLNARRLPAFLMAAFGVLALLLASVGVYALFANLASARKQEFGVRMALGSSPARIATLILHQGAKWTVAGLAGGAVGIGVIGYALRDLLYGVSPFDPITIGLAVVALVASGAVAVMIPLRRVTRLDPRAVLR